MLKYVKYLLAGFLAAVVIVTPVAASAIELTLKLFEVSANDTVKIVFDGEEAPLPENMHVLNYKDANYTSVRYIAENLGADVQYDEAENIIYLSKEPQEDIVIKIEPEQIYNELPLKYKTSEWDVTVVSGVRGNDNNPTFRLLFEKAPEALIKILYEDVYIEHGGEKAYADEGASTESWNSVTVGRERTIAFDSLDIDSGKLDTVKMVLPVSIFDDLDKEERIITFLFRIKMD